jgi:septal ring factor EnvC (AmiA/AmiB activator)
MENNTMEPEYATQQFEQTTAEPSQSASPLEIDQLIEQIGVRYIADLQALSEQFGRFYDAQLAAKDQQIGELQQRLLATERERAAQDDQLAKLQQRLETAERERNSNAAQMRELKRTSARYIADLRALSDQLSEQVDLSDAAEQTLEVGRSLP